jgi:hypothetical protein
VRDAVGAREQHVHRQRHPELARRLGEPLAGEQRHALRRLARAIERVAAHAEHGRARRRLAAPERRGHARRAQRAHERAPAAAISEHRAGRLDEHGPAGAPRITRRAAGEPDVRRRGRWRRVAGAERRRVAGEQRRIEPCARDDRGLAAPVGPDHEHHRARLQPAAPEARARRAQRGQRLVGRRAARGRQLGARRPEPPQRRGSEREPEYDEGHAQPRAFAVRERERRAEQPRREEEHEEHHERCDPARLRTAGHGGNRSGAGSGTRRSVDDRSPGPVGRT